VSEPKASVDALGLQCPLPVFHARDALFDLAPGDLLEVLADDPQAPSDFEKWCPKNGHRLIAVEVRGLAFRMLIEKGRES
jgi:TusA-related sulfurtransferase